MKIKDYLNDFYSYSGKASDLNRQLAFAGIALIWLFKRDAGGVLTIPTELVRPGILVVLSLILDMMQYCLASIIWYCFYRHLEKKNVPENRDVTHSVWLERPITTFFWAKIICIILAYIGILHFLVKTLLH